MFLEESSPNNLEEKQKTEKKSKNYFDVREEEAVKDYITAETQLEKEEIYNKFLKEPLDKMIESIIRRYKLYRKDMEYRDLHTDTHSFLMTKVDKFKPAKNKKAYSYFGTITKRYLILKNKKNYQKLQDKGDLAEVDDDKKIKEETINSYYSQDYSITEFMSLYIAYVDKHLERLFPKEVDAKTADAILELFRKCESLDIFNKKALYIYIREMVDVDTPQITKIIKKLKVIYVDLYNKYYQTGYVKI
jgi:hypothetical protein